MTDGDERIPFNGICPDGDTEEDFLEDSPSFRTFTVPEEADGMRLDRFLADASAGELTRSGAVRLLETGHVTWSPSGKAPGGDLGAPRVPDKKQRLSEGDEVTVLYPDPADYTVRPEPIPLAVVYEDEDIIVINKPAGMVVHPAPGHESGTLVHALLYHCGDSLSGVGGVRKPGIVHRIDKDTSGLLVVAKNDAAHAHLSAQLQDHTVSRVYRALCIGQVREDEGTVSLPIGRCPTDRKKMAVFPVGREQQTGGSTVRRAVTHYRVLERYFVGSRFGQTFTYIQCELETGRTHQIRVHMASLGHPLLGDPVYGGEGTRFGRAVAPLLHGQCLHAAELRLIHPRTQEEMHFTCPMPEDFSKILNRLESETAHD